ncbi:uncharacterized protein AC631_05530 [Debaryomyces fabryi]|uniref:Zn(2)-C6 fungal-type domain-containing protein n=1 Tax=Debaryomyces fabryi TaxID=58627 RepID=A0A0V1PRD6_9ASCO|nr:uncharacterized protein AC631_05530 [Debaryomyces fabryi]KRZ98713.1 hypothetical protein AC631_05530 [Debaryomyces fabryi]CUM57046.1 unnamed protein product [Debaryomyces fabryi]
MESISQRKIAKAKQANIACLECRSVKKKCDQQFPKCSLCLKKNKTCQYVVKNHRKPASKSYVKSLLDRIAVLEQLCKPQDHKNEVQEERLDQHMNLSKYHFGDFVQKVPPYSSSSTQTGVSKESCSERSTNSIAPYDPNEPLMSLGTSLVSKWELGFAQNGTLLFEGPTSSRYISIFDVHVQPTPKLHYTQDVLDNFHKEVFSWFFDYISSTFPLIDEQLFWESLNYDDVSEELGPYASVSLINAIMAFYFLNHGNLNESRHFQSLSFKQVNEEVFNDPKIVAVQTLILLSMISMTEGKEFQASDAISRSVSLSYHLGLHVGNYKLKNERKISEEEANIRDSVFWCCFMVDKLRSSILGMSHYMNCNDISVKLPAVHSSQPNKASVDSFRDTIVYSDMQTKMFEKCFSAEFILFLSLNNNETGSLKQRQVVSEATVALSKWKRDMSTNARYSNNKSLSNLFLEVLQHTYKILINKSLVSFSEINTIVDEEDLPINICTDSAEQIIYLCRSQDISKSPFLYHFLYSLYLAATICLYKISSPNLETKDYYGSYLNQAILIFESYKAGAPVSDTYLCHLEKYRKKWFISEQ